MLIAALLVVANLLGGYAVARLVMALPDPLLRVEITAPAFTDVPDTTYDWRGMA